DLLGGELELQGLTPAEVRAASSGGMSPRDETGLSAVEDIKVGGAEGMLPARLYRPEGVAGSAPVIVFFHGGGWTIGSIDSAGGNLAAVVCLLARERGGPAIRAQALVYPACDLTLSYPSIKENGKLGYLLSDMSIRWFTDHYIGGCDHVDWRASPLEAEDL